MATADIDDIYFSSTAPDLKKRKIGVGADPFSTQYAMGMYDEDVTTPKVGYDVPEIEEKEQEIDVPGGAEALDTDIESAAMLFTDQEKEEERKKLSKYVDPLGIQMQQLNKFSDEASKIRSEFTPARGIGISTAPPASLAGQGAADLGELGEEVVGEEPAQKDIYVPDTGFDKLIGEGWERSKKFATDQYYKYFPTKYGGEYTITTSPSGSGGAYLGAGVNLATYAQPFATGLGTTATQASIGLSSAPAASLAGQAGTGAQAGAQAGAAGWGASSTKALGQLASVWSIYQGIKAGGQGYVDAAMAASVLATGGATAIPVAIISGLRALFGMSRRGKQKVPFGGADLQAQGGKLQATKGYGYNNYNVKAGQAGAASVADYVNTYVRHFGLGFNASKWNQAVKDDPRMGRYDTMDDSGYADPSVLIRKVFETKGIVSGNPSVGGVPITSQEQYEQATKDFNEHYTKIAVERGGLYHANLAASDQVDFSNLKREGVPDQINFSQQMQGEELKSHRQLTTRTTSTSGRGGGSRTEVGYWKPGGRAGPTWVQHTGPTYIPQGPYTDPIPIKKWTEDVTSPYDVLYYNLMGKFNRGSGGTGY